MRLPLYDAALAAVDTASAEAESTLAQIDLIEDQALAFQTCVEIVQSFDMAERGLRAIRERADRNGLKLFRQMRREKERTR